jgi:hypothetical protein
LRFAEALREGQILRFHSGQDVVASSIDDGREALDPVAREGFSQRANDGNSAPDRSLEGGATPFLAARRAAPCLASSASFADEGFARGERLPPPCGAVLAPISSTKRSMPGTVPEPRNRRTMGSWRDDPRCFSFGRPRCQLPRVAGRSGAVCLGLPAEQRYNRGSTVPRPQCRCKEAV